AISIGCFVAAFAAASVYGSALTNSRFAGSTTNAPMLIAAIATAVNPTAARGVEGSYRFMLLPEHRSVDDPPSSAGRIEREPGHDQRFAQRRLHDVLRITLGGHDHSAAARKETMRAEVTQSRGRVRQGDFTARSFSF